MISFPSKPFILSTLVLFLGTTSSLHAGLLAYESFDYVTGSNTAVGQTGGTGWNGGWQSVSNDADITSGSLTPSGNSAGLETLGNRVSLPSGNFHRIGRELDLSNGGVFDLAGLVNGSGDLGADNTQLYFSYTVQTSVTDGFYEFELHRNDLGDRGRVGGIGDDASGSNLNIRTPSLGKANAITARTTDVTFVVVKVNFLTGDDTISVYLDPTLGAEPITADLTLTGAGDLSFDGISLAGSQGESFDEIRFGTTFTDVTAVPEPGTYALLIGLTSLGLVIGVRWLRS